eukprot:gene33321-42706_t
MKYLGVEDSAAEEKVGVKDSAAEEKVVEEMRVAAKHGGHSHASRIDEREGAPPRMLLQKLNATDRASNLWRLQDAH